MQQIVAARKRGNTWRWVYGAALCEISENGVGEK